MSKQLMLYLVVTFLTLNILNIQRSKTIAKIGGENVTLII